MSDADLRELERRFRETGSVEDEAAWLRARVQVGELERRRLELTAYVGYQPAQAALEVGKAILGAPLRDPLSWCESLPEQSTEVLARCAIAAARSSLPLWARFFPDDSRPSAATRVAEAWVCDRQVVEAEEVVAAGWAADIAAQDAHETGDDVLPAAYYQTVQDAAMAAAGAVRMAIEGTDSLGQAIGVLACASEAVGEEELGVAISHEIVPWALGYGDPVRDRVEACQRAEAAGE